MAVKKPRRTCSLIEGLAIGSPRHRNLADTFNWLVSCWENIKGVTGVEDGKPVVASGGGSIGGFKLEGGYIRAGVVMIGRQAVRVPEVSASDGEWRIVVDIYDRMAHLELGSGFDPPNGSISYIPLYVIQDGAIATDYRGATTVQAWE
jgi:hypothetical protein